MIKHYIHRLLEANKSFLLEQAVAIKGFMQLLMKQRNTGEKWTRREKREIRRHLKMISWSVPAIVIFLLPGGGFLFPVLAEILDRRKKKR